MPRRTTDPRESVLAAIETATAEVRRDGDQTLPLGRKAVQTRKALLAAAARRFVADGYANTSVAGIAEEAGVSLGTVYQYFRDRADIIAALAGDAARAMLRNSEQAWRVEDGRAGVRRVLAPFISSYAASARFQAVWEEVTHVDADLAYLRRELVRAFTAATESALRRGVAHGVMRADLDPPGTAIALTAMVDRTCYLRFVFDKPRGRPDLVEETTDLLTDLWVHALGITD